MVTTKKLPATNGAKPKAGGGPQAEVESSDAPTIRTDEPEKNAPAEGLPSSDVPTIRDDQPSGAIASAETSSDEPTDERPTLRKDTPAEQYPAGATVLADEGQEPVPRTLVSGGDEAEAEGKPPAVAVAEARASATPDVLPSPRKSLVAPLVATLAIVIVLAGAWILTRDSGEAVEEPASGSDARGEPAGPEQSAQPSEHAARPSTEARHDEGAPVTEGSTTGKLHPDGGTGAPSVPAGWPTVLPSTLPTALPTLLPTAFPTALPSAWPTGFPTAPAKTTSSSPSAPAPTSTK